jgi:hypothetical protein
MPQGQFKSFSKSVTRKDVWVQVTPSVLVFSFAILDKWGFAIGQPRTRRMLSAGRELTRSC